MRIPDLRRARAILLFLLCLAAPSLRAQDAKPVGISVSGVVLDVYSGAPVEGAVVRVGGREGRSAVTDSAGRFVVRGAPAGEQRWVVSRLGYASWEQEVEAADGDAFTVRILPHPTALEGITVVADRFEERRRAAGTSVRAAKRGEILGSGDATAFQVLSKVGVTPTRCSDSDAGMECAWVRGSRVRVSLVIDEELSPGGLEQLYGYNPAELYLVEAYSGGSTVRVYTNYYVEQLARRGGSIPPLNWAFQRGAPSRRP